MRPENALKPARSLGPRARSKSSNISDDTFWTIARMRWRQPDGEWDNRIGMRYNGDLNDEDDKGNPRSHSQGTWFGLAAPDRGARGSSARASPGPPLSTRVRLGLRESLDTAKVLGSRRFSLGTRPLARSDPRSGTDSRVFGRGQA